MKLTLIAITFPLLLSITCDGRKLCKAQGPQHIVNLSSIEGTLQENRRTSISQRLPVSKRNDLTRTLGKLSAISYLLENDPSFLQDHDALVAAGVVLGDAFVQDFTFKWIAVEDECGRTPALIYPGTTVILYPLTMISKRIENNERVDIHEMYQGIQTSLKEIPAEARLPDPK